jgi:energy-coupling factor transporter ATP-binding protein EcfA2
MELTKFRVQNYRSVNDSGDIEVQQVTDLVGRNESGKSALLLALASLNPPGGRKALTKIKDFPRGRRLGECTDDTPVVTTLWKLTTEEITQISDKLGFGPRELGTLSNWLSRHGLGNVPEERNGGERWRDYVRHAAEGAILGSRELGTLSNWLSRRTLGNVPDAAWPKRYGGNYTPVLEFFDKSFRAEQKARLHRNSYILGMSVLLLILFGLAYYQWQAAVQTALIIHAKMIALHATRDHEGPAQALLVAMQAKKAGLPDISETERTPIPGSYEWSRRRQAPACRVHRNRRSRNDRRSLR